MGQRNAGYDGLAAEAELSVSRKLAVSRCTAVHFSLNGKQFTVWQMQAILSSLASIDSNTANTNCPLALGIYFLIHPSGWIKDDRINQR